MQWNLSIIKDDVATDPYLEEAVLIQLSIAIKHRTFFIS